MAELALELAQKISDMEDGNDLAVSAVAVGNAIGYPTRVLDEEQESREGEHSGFDEAYDFACDLLDSDECEVEQEDGMFWFTEA